jgi:hypothetical protein
MNPVRTIALVFLVWAPGCAPSPSGFEVVDDLAGDVQLADCRPIPPPVPGAPAQIVGTTDGGFLVNDAVGRRTWALTPERTVRFAVTYDREGPLGILDPQDVALFQDTLLAFADRPARRIRLIHRSGRDAGAIDLSFPPERVASWRDGLLIAATVLTRSQASILHYWSPATGVVALGVSPSDVRDPRMRALANLTLLLPLEHDAAVSVHQFIVSRAVHIDSEGRLDELSVPVLRGLADRIGRTPLPPYTEDELAEVATPALDALALPGGTGLWVLTRTGSVRGGFAEKAILRLGPDLKAQAGLRLPVNAGHLAPGSGPGLVVVVTDRDEWHECTAP